MPKVGEEKAKLKMSKFKHQTRLSKRTHAQKQKNERYLGKEPLLSLLSNVSKNSLEWRSIILGAGMPPKSMHYRLALRGTSKSS
jgi:hypothetical protein